MDTYPYFAELARCEKRNEDYAIICRNLHSSVAVMAPHGGGIEPGTVDIADAIAGDTFTFYAFKGLKRTGNKVLHLNSNSFDEPLAGKVSHEAEVVVSIHGAHGEDDIVLVGGRHEELKQALMLALRAGGFKATICEIPGLRGIQPDNLCNRCRTGKGVQLEISRGLREKLFDQLGHRSLRVKTVLFFRFVDIVKGVLSSYSQEQEPN
ncbi:MAG TPA: poly-gamma-glutamate hydrolase family protein [Thermodesulfobacteriota bacterium]|nr:poly-gamma-glutamate hydrolase family protein [Thermodesulfobacteriota bacterium]